MPLFLVYAAMSLTIHKQEASLLNLTERLELLPNAVKDSSDFDLGPIFYEDYIFSSDSEASCNPSGQFCILTGLF